MIIFYARYYHFRNIEKITKKKKNQQKNKQTKIVKTKGKNPRPSTSQRNSTATRH